jgi:hypothetical protein
LAKSKALDGYDFWFRKKYNLPPNDDRYLDIEPWKMELEFLTHDEYEKAVRRASGITQDEEFEGASDKEMEEYLKQAQLEASQSKNPSDEWVEVKDAK